MKPVLMLCAALMFAPVSARALIGYDFTAEIFPYERDQDGAQASGLIVFHEKLEDSIWGMGVRAVKSFDLRWDGGYATTLDRNDDTGASGYAFSDGPGNLLLYEVQTHYKYDGYFGNAYFEFLVNAPATNSYVPDLTKFAGDNWFYLIPTDNHSDNQEGPIYALEGRFTSFSRRDIPSAPVPEPATMALMGLGLVGAAVARRRFIKS